MDKNDKKNKTSKEDSRLGAVGGQAVLEGVMMKSKTDIAIAVRRENGEIVKSLKPSKSVRDKYKILNIPIVRGVVNFVEMLSMSMSTMTESAEMLGLEEALSDKAADTMESGEVKENEENKEKSTNAKDLKDEANTSHMTLIASIVGTVLGLALAVGLFFFLPVFIGNQIKLATGFRHGWFVSIIEGITRLAIFLAYILLVSLLKDIRRTFEYHGAEHMSVFCYEAYDDLTVENARKYSRFHPRCGTSFLIVMMIVGVIISMLIPVSLGMWLRFLVKIIIFPFVIGFGYEFIRYAGKHSSNIIVRIVSAPGLWIQRITTKKPDDKQLEVAIVSLRAALKMDPIESAEGVDSPVNTGLAEQTSQN
ncbi:MAG: DUF1385 domain-containing protein [Oscillospiraceae bacterium]|nr:DUF1385 domain-containing protein [Oscillospiraceae bacterium]